MEIPMKPRFALPTERDLRFTRNSGFRPEDFGEEVRIVDSVVNGAFIIAALFGLLAVLAGVAAPRDNYGVGVGRGQRVYFTTGETRGSAGK